ncbi:MAG: Eco57I restriction-modification methylase domain-containing protein [Ignavibacteriales bacterium]|nr:Eco57I restriction-modification methylase domain-containing protein [Ignavibacteriales bacterium]
MKSFEKILPIDNELPVDYADRIGLSYSVYVSQYHKKNKGQFLTPSPIARFMGKLAESNKNQISILDPGCGTAILSCAIIEHLASSNFGLETINLDAYEIDNEIFPFTTNVLNYLKDWLSNKNISFNYNLIQEDFILKNADVFKSEISLFNNHTTIEYDFVISNPPYFKLNKEDKRAKAAESISSGQSNIYALFMAVSSKMLSHNGQLIFITPRSYASGRYFKSFREFFFSNVSLNQIHLFDSRKDTFNRDNVLQETLILKASKSNCIKPDAIVAITSTKGISDLSSPRVKTYPQNQILNLKSKEKILHIPINDEEEEIIDLFRGWTGSLNKYNIQISTGPVVAFRATEYIQELFVNETVSLAPLIWLHNVFKMHIDWPVHKPNKGQYIQICSDSLSLLLPNKNYVLLRRFSAKDDKSRLIASPYFAKLQDAEFVGIENKVNYIYRPKGELQRNEVIGLAAIFNSKLFDNYFRIFNGNVNVSATELREMPLPPLELIKQIGDQLILYNADFSQELIDNLVTHTLTNINELVL